MIHLVYSTYLKGHPLVSYLIILLSSFGITFSTIPSIMHVADFHQFYDDPGHTRKSHSNGIPRLGGIAIFVSFTLTLLLLCSGHGGFPVNYLLTGCIMLFAMGLKDDLKGVNASTKLVIELLAAVIIVVLGEVRFSSMYGLFGIYEISYAVSIILSIVTIIFLINAFNLIDGIDGLAGITGIAVNLAFAIISDLTGHYELAMISLAMAGAILGFIKYNLTPAKIFMGDTGSLLIGLVSAVMAISFIESHKFVSSTASIIITAPAIAIAILIGPIADTLRVFTLRILKGESPFKADRNHIHHRMLEFGLSHLKITIILITFNLIILVLAFVFSAYGNAIFIGGITFILLLSNWFLEYLIRRQSKKEHVAWPITKIFKTKV